MQTLEILEERLPAYFADVPSLAGTGYGDLASFTAWIMERVDVFLCKRLGNSIIILDGYIQPRERLRECLL